MTYAAHAVSVAHAKDREVDKPKRKDENLSGPRMSEIRWLCNFLRRMYVSETATTTVAAPLIQPMFNQSLA